MSTRIVENGVKMMKLWLKQGSKDLFAIDLYFQGLALKKPGTKMRLNLNYRGYLEKLELLDYGLDFVKGQGLNRRNRTLLQLLLNKGGLQVDIQKRKGLF